MTLISFFFDFSQGLMNQIQSIATVNTGCVVREGRRPSSFSLACAASNSQRKNPDFSRQSKGFSRGRNRQSSSDNPEEAGNDTLTSKNGPLLSLSSNSPTSNPRHQATTSPGQREREIVELFRKVQAQLRERAAAKEDKKAETPTPSQGQGGERGTVDSLLKLLRKHSVDQGKKAKERSNLLEDQGQSFFESSSMGDAEEVQPVARRPPSSFQRRSPVPRVKFQPVVYSVDEEMEKMTPKQAVLPEEEEEPISLDDREEEEEEEEEGEVEVEEKSEELSSLKLSELRALAKSKGLKGYSKLKKSEIVELLTGEGYP